jgi:tetratricopeptide (TPR) repeat protein
MHPSALQLQAFGRCRLLYAPARRVLEHLCRGCRGCWVVLSPYLIPWLDDEAAAEARATDAADAGPGLRAAYIEAAQRAARAAARLRSTETGEEAIRRVVKILEAEGVASLGRLPRHLMGRPAIGALLRLCREWGPADPSLRLRLAELASDLASWRQTGPAGDAANRKLRFRGHIELAHTHRMLGEHRSAQEGLNLAGEELRQGEHDELLEAELIENQAALLGDQHRLRAAVAGMASAISVYRRRGVPGDLARALVRYANLYCLAAKFQPALDNYQAALVIVDDVREPMVAGSAMQGSCETLLLDGRWGEALSLFRCSRPMIDRSLSALNGARTSRLEGRLLDRAGDAAGAARAYAHCRGVFTAFGKRYVAAVTLLDQAAALERQGDLAGSRTLVFEGTDKLLELQPQQEVFAALMLLRATRRFSAARPALSLDRVIDYLDAAEFNPSLRLQFYLQ